MNFNQFHFIFFFLQSETICGMWVISNNNMTVHFFIFYCTYIIHKLSKKLLGCILIYWLSHKQLIFTCKWGHWKQKFTGPIGKWSSNGSSPENSVRSKSRVTEKTEKNRNTAQKNRKVRTALFKPMCDS